MARTASKLATKSSKTKSHKRPSERRRSVVLIGGSMIVAALILVAWFPASTILSQRQSLNVTTDQLAIMRNQDAALANEQATLTSPADVSRLSREEYQLVEPGQRLIQVLPPSGTPTQAGTGQAPFPGDPGLTKPVAPSAIALLPTGTTTTTSPGAPPSVKSTVKTSSKSSTNGLWHRILSTLTFWHR